MQHAWPGNVRELMHLLERAVLMAAGTQIERHDLALSVAPSTTDAASMRGAKQRLVQDFERGYITQLLAEHGGNITHAATAAGKNRRAFFALMRKHGINAHDAG
jgi:DNA-binding NtrC family response regulator